MTWRRFLVLMRGLSPNSASVNAATGRHEIGKSTEKVNTVVGPKATQQAFEALFGGPKPSA